MCRKGKKREEKKICGKEEKRNRVTKKVRRGKEREGDAKGVKGHEGEKGKGR